MGIVGTVLTLGGGVAGLILFGLFASRSADIGIGPAAKEVGDSFGSFGKGIGEIGTGAATFGTGIGTGISGLFAPFISLFKLFNPQATAQNSALKSATQPATTQQSNTRASKATSFIPQPGDFSIARNTVLREAAARSGGGSSLVTGFLSGPGGL